jgi:hypothetical protein
MNGCLYLTRRAARRELENGTRNTPGALCPIRRSSGRGVRCLLSPLGMLVRATTTHGLALIRGVVLGSWLVMQTNNGWPYQLWCALSLALDLRQQDE